MALRNRLFAAASALRNALNEVPPWESFPHGYCTAASWLLVTYLVEWLGIEPIEVVAKGERQLPTDDPDLPTRQGHMWVEHGSFIVDITADQFEDRSETVIVTTDRTWHDQFIGQTRYDQREFLPLRGPLIEHFRNIEHLLRVPAK